MMLALGGGMLALVMGLAQQAAASPHDAKGSHPDSPVAKWESSVRVTVVGDGHPATRPPREGEVLTLNAYGFSAGESVEVRRLSQPWLDTIRTADAGGVASYSFVVGEPTEREDVVTFQGYAAVDAHGHGGNTVAAVPHFSFFRFTTAR